MLGKNLSLQQRLYAMGEGRAADGPYGLIEAAIIRDDIAVPDGAWEGIAAFS